MAVRFTSSSQSYSRTISIPASQAFTIACWVKISVNRGDVTVWCLNQENSNYTYLGTDSDGTTMGVWTSAEAIQQATRNLTVGVWYFVAVTSDSSGTGTVYSRALTETAFQSATWDWDLAGDSITKLVISGYTTSSPPDWLNGCVSGLTWWSAELSAAELLVESHSQLPVRTIGLRAWWPLIQAGDTADYSGKGLTLSGSGAATEDGPGVRWRQRRRTLITPLEVPAEVLPGPLGVAAAVPAPGVSTSVSVHPVVIPVTAAVPVPSVYTGNALTPVNPAAIAIAAGVPAPVVDTVKNAVFTPEVLAIAARIPEPAVLVPVNPGDDLTGKGQISFNGFKMGGGTVYSLQRITGSPWDMPQLDQGDEPHPSADGALPGQDLAQARILTVEMLIKAPRDEIEAAAEAFVLGLPKAVADERPFLALQVLDRIWVGRGRVTQRAVALDKRTPVGLAAASVQFTMSDPRFYSRELLSATVPDGGSVDVVNAGNTSTFPRFRFRGPAHTPLVEISWLDLDGNQQTRVIEYDVEVGVGESMTIDVQRGTVMIGEESQARARVNGSVSIPDMALGPGTSTISYETSEGGAPPLVALWNHAII